ncbi:sulfur carrier protein ThiS [Aureimonas fodinaquatilis]|uniref:Sulfur carrier protein ThiS n=1 Tax=Aureimonas fodinaquatilis TaxID=2565783 RepID=A0A5B0E0F9_9HYPH|nr:sulfur carrier protein ThiS [Aureimonas fodinaquatilis]KAA0972554.1 sulfur carrier protein ThiS [Aureimonas fodinaquatilis]
MKLQINGDSAQSNAPDLAALVSELGYDENRVATALNRVFVPRLQREAARLTEGDSVEILAPMQGG